MHNVTVQQPLTTVSPNSNPIIVMLQSEAGFVSKHDVIPFRYPCPPFIASVATQTPVVFSQGTYTKYYSDCPHAFNEVINYGKAVSKPLRLAGGGKRAKIEY
ncbi:uncharacterized protein TNCV_1517741 [Trichonephila clavipes]|nr:uncharacterized protein TNCV_1517741 [Trichonephila clavipes]